MPNATRDELTCFRQLHYFIRVNSEIFFTNTNLRIRIVDCFKTSPLIIGTQRWFYIQGLLWQHDGLFVLPREGGTAGGRLGRDGPKDEGGKDV